MNALMGFIKGLSGFGALGAERLGRALGYGSESWLSVEVQSLIMA